MDLESLQQGDQIVITNTKGEQHNAGFVEFTENGLMVEFSGFGSLEIKWVDVDTIDMFIAGYQRDDSYGPSYKATLWKKEIS